MSCVYEVDEPAYQGGAGSVTTVGVPRGVVRTPCSQAMTHLMTLKKPKPRPRPRRPWRSQGLHTKVAQVAAAALGLPLAAVYIAETATDKVPNASPTAASASSDMYGAAGAAPTRSDSMRCCPNRYKAPCKGHALLMWKVRDMAGAHS